MKENIIYFSSDEWGGTLKTSQYHIALRLSRQNRVLYINSIGLRRPNVSRRDAIKIKNKLKSWFQGIQQIDENLSVITPIVLPFHNLKVIQKINRLLLIGFIKYCQVRLNLKNPIIFTFMPNVVTVIKEFKEKKVVYYCADQMSSFKGVAEKTVRQMEDKLLELSDVVFTTSKKLYQEKSAKNRHTLYMPHGVDFDLFNNAVNGDMSVPEDIVRMTGPVLGFFGLISKDWIDFDLLLYLARKHPEWTLLMIGKIDEPIPSEVWKMDNIHLIGPRRYENLPAYLKKFDVALIPFVQSELTRHCNPIKVKEYLAAGKPVVSVDLYELNDLKDVVEVASSHQEFEMCIQNVLKNDSEKLVKRRIEKVRHQTWDDRFEKIFEILSSD